MKDILPVLPSLLSRYFVVHACLPPCLKQDQSHFITLYFDIYVHHSTGIFNTLYVCTLKLIPCNIMASKLLILLVSMVASYVITLYSVFE